MKFFIDTASLDQIKEANSLGILDGVTTNPSLMAKEGISGEKNILKHYETIAEIVDGDVSAEVIATDFDGIVEEGKRLAAIAPNIVVKVPMIKEGVKALSYFRDQGIRTNCTLVFSAGQAILAAKAGATYVSPFIGRIDDINWNGMQLIEEMAEIYSIQGFETEILAASIRSSMHIIDAARAGADVVTCPLEPILGLLKHPLTDIGLEKFLADHKKANQTVTQ
ncbi:MAG: fructose-6-phosphate aldolase [Phaeodactylibacter sp.]|nr:fructose-6-phosphate aldolase [Phaeodactylibacter sp.]MCB9050759.1 fructose-6-phosphate aldolase [Lewinellaceae bacterium]